MEKTTIYLPVELKTTLKSTARRTKRTEAAIVREAVAVYLAEESASGVLPKSFGMVSDGSYDASEDEAFFEANWKPDW